LAGRDADRIFEELRAIVLKTMAISRFGAAHRRGHDQRAHCSNGFPVAPRPTQRITLLGDAIHAMTAHRGIGANLALKDAVRLCRALQAVNCGEQTFSMRFAPTRPR
jgi:2-polyprenyl-6-methoxyphenol hydroxylase-like FAD-dependent oxidoreductase